MTLIIIYIIPVFIRKVSHFFTYKHKVMARFNFISRKFYGLNFYSIDFQINFNKHLNFQCEFQIALTNSMSTFAV